MFQRANRYPSEALVEGVLAGQRTARKVDSDVHGATLGGWLAARPEAREYRSAARNGPALDGLMSRQYPALPCTHADARTGIAATARAEVQLWALRGNRR